ncbi:MAG TPA: ABC transporter permease [Candidatus Gracilibacteria bacterium]|nr:ABC transporter permease [Candidatus Gracilibacteria bacterium]
MNKWVAYKTIMRKEVVRFMRIWPQTLLPPVITQSLYFIIFGTFIGSQVADINGVSYMAFIVPGLVMMAVINGAFQNVVSSFFSTKFMRNVDELLVSPVPNWLIIAGYCGGGVLRGVLVGLIVFFVSIFFTQPEIHNIWIILMFVTLTSLLFSLGGFLNALFARKFDDISVFSVFILTPLTYFGGVFYSIDDLPGFWQGLSKFNPILYMIDGFRYGFHGFSDVNIWWSVAMLLTFTVVISVLCLYLMRKGVGLKN